MDELIKLVVDKTGISEELAQEVVGIVIEYLKDKLPAPISGQVEKILEGEGADGLVQGLGGLLGGK